MPPLVVSGMAGSPGASKNLQTAHSQVRQLHSGPTPAQPSFDIPQSAMQANAASTIITTPVENKTPSSAGYFGFVVDPNDPVYGTHSQKNWSPASSSIRSAAARSPLPVHLENPPTPFQIQTEALAQKLQLQRSVGSRVDKDSGRRFGHAALLSSKTTEPSDGDYFSAVRTGSPIVLENSDIEPWPPISAPPSLRTTPGLLSPTLKLPTPRAASVPNSPADGLPALIKPAQLAELIYKCSTNSLLLLDVRTYKLFATSRISTAVNLCIPTTLLKRPSFNVAKLSDTFANNQDKKRFDRWQQMKYIVVYDADSQDPGDPSALAALHTLKKFSREGWDGLGYLLKGGFAAFSDDYPDKIDTSPLPNTTNTPKGSLSLNGASGTDKGPGGVFNCPLPVQQSVVNPFFSNIRQNMDLIDGVGEIPINLPTTMGSKCLSQLPAWLYEVACKDDGSKIVADRFLNIERAEQRRMQDALNVSVVYDSPTSINTKPHTLAGVEKGAKNRYNNIWPYDHSRVKLQEYPHEECDYVNASHVSVPHSRKRYIASQAPLPSTFRDFWCMVWEQDVRVIVMLTAEEEGGRLKSHKYWETDEYGALKLTRIQERKVSLEPTSLKTSPKRRSVSTTGQSSSADSSIPYIIARTFTLEHTGLPFAPLREITQLQYSAWPDLGTPAHPSHVLGLVEHTDAVVRASTSSEAAVSRRPVLVHCSAGCGRTGTFCTVDSVISMLKQQRMRRKRQMQQQEDGSDGDGDMKMKQLGLEDDSDWINCDENDLVFKAVSELRDQRISMVQCLQQYVLCYETVLEWLAKQGPLDSGKRKA